ncbi:MAG: hypothetical protein AB8G11_09710, partial [Saprospiraceae bacterium]
MATIIELKDLVNCGVGSNLGTGSKGCQAILKATTSIWLTRTGFKFDKTADISSDSSYVKQLQAEGKLIILKGVKEFTTNREENVTETDGDGTIRVVRKGLYAFNAMFKKGFNYQSALSSISSFGAYDALFVDSDGNILGTVANDGSLKGITTGMVEADGISFSTFTETMSQGLTFQFLDRTEVDVDYFFISAKELNWYPQRLDGVNQAVVSFDAIPTDGATTFNATVKFKQGSKPITGLVVGNFLFKNQGATVVPTSVVEGTDGTYAFTVATVNTDNKLE